MIATITLWFLKPLEVVVKDILNEVLSKHIPESLEIYQTMK